MSTGRAVAGVVLPVYLATSGFSALELGALFVVVALASTAMSAAIGVASDRIGRKAFMVAVPWLTAAAAAAIAFTTVPAAIFIAAAAGSLGRGGGAGGGQVGPYRPAEMALIADSVPARVRTAALGRLTVASSVGALVGSLLVSLLAHGHPSRVEALPLYRPAFLIVAATAFAAGLLALWLREPKAAPLAGEPARVPMLPVRSRPLLYRLWVTNTLNGAAVGLFGPFVVYWFFVRYGADAAEIGALFAVVNALAVLSSLSSASFGARWGVVRATTLFRVLQAVLLVPMVLAPWFQLAGALYTVRMLAQRVALPLRQSFVLGMADPAERARVTAWSNVPSQLTASATPAAAGALFSAGLLEAPFLLGAGLQLANALTFYFFFRSHRPEEELVDATNPGVADG